MSAGSEAIELFRPHPRGQARSVVSVPVSTACGSALAAWPDDVVLSRIQAAARSLALRYSAGDEVSVAAVAHDYTLDAERDGLVVRVQRAVDGTRMALAVDAVAAADHWVQRFARNLAALLG